MEQDQSHLSAYKVGTEHAPHDRGYRNPVRVLYCWSDKSETEPAAIYGDILTVLA